MQYSDYSEAVKILNIEKIGYFSLFLLKTLIVGTCLNRLAVRMAYNHLTCTHSLCFGAKLRKIGKHQFY